MFTDDQIDGHLELKREEICRFEHTPHPIEFAMYYSACAVVTVVIFGASVYLAHREAVAAGRGAKPATGSE